MGNEIANESHCDVGRVSTKTGSRAQIGIFVFLRKSISGQAENAEWHTGIPVSWSCRWSPRVATSSFAAKIQASFYGLESARFLKILVAELLSRNGAIDILTYVRNMPYIKSNRATLLRMRSA